MEGGRKEEEEAFHKDSLRFQFVSFCARREIHANASRMAQASRVTGTYVTRVIMVIIVTSPPAVTFKWRRACGRRSQWAARVPLPATARACLHL